MAKRKPLGDDDVTLIIKLIMNKGRGKVLIAARHNLRERQAEMGADDNINPLRSHLNVTLAGPATAQGVSDLATELMGQAGIFKLRTDAGRSVECVVTLPTDTTIDTDEFFKAAFDHVKTHKRFAGLPVLSAAIHYDEDNPHLHVLLLPLIETTIKAGVTKMAMRGSDVHGNTSNKRAALRADFYEQVGKFYGLCCPAAPERLTMATRGKSADLLMGALQSAPELLDRPDVARVLRQMFYRNPVPILTALGLAIPTTRKASKKLFAEIMTQPCSLENTKPIGFTVRANHADSSENTKPIGFTVSDSDGYGERVEQSHTCGWFPKSTAHNSAFPLTDTDATDAPTTASESHEEAGRKSKIIDVGLALKMRESGTHMNLIADYFGCKKSKLYSLLPHPAKTLAQRQQPELFG